MQSKEPPKLNVWEEVIAYVSLGVLCGWYYILTFAAPILIYLTIRGSALATTIIALLIGSAVMYVNQNDRVGCNGLCVTYSRLYTPVQTVR